MKAWLHVVALVALAGCASTPRKAPAAVAPAPAAVTPAPSAAATRARQRFSEAVHWSRNSAEHRAAFLQTYALAARAVERASAGLAVRTWAVILDADETVVDNSAYQIEHSGGHYDVESWQAFVRQRASPPLPGAKAFIEAVKGRGGIVAIVTNRAAAICPDTEADFQAFAIAHDVMLCGSGDKNPRFEQVANGEALPGLGPLRVVAWIGDNIRDFPGLDQPVRQKSDDAFDGFGTRFFILPNPMYGSWEKSQEE